MTRRGIFCVSVLAKNEECALGPFQLIPIRRPFTTPTPVSRMAGLIATSAFNQLGQYASSPGTGPLLRRTRRFFPIAVA